MTTIVEDLVPEIVVEVSDIALKGDPGEQGIQGIAGPAVTLTVGSVTEVSPGSASASITGTSPDLFLNLELPVGVTEEDFTIALDSLTALVNGKATPSDIATAITALSLGTASQHDVSYFARPSDVTNAVASEATARTNAISSAISNLVNSAPGVLDTLGEIATRITDDETGVAAILATVTAVQTALTTKAPLASPALTGTPTAPTTATSDNSSKLATTAFVKAVVSALSGDYATVDEPIGAAAATAAAAAQTTANAAAPKTRTINGKPLSADVTLSASDVGAAAKSANLSDLASPVAALANLGGDPLPNVGEPTIWVTSHGSDANTGLTPGAAKATVGAAIAALVALTGGTGLVEVGVGTFTESPLTRPSGCLIRGCGWALTTIKLANGSTGNVIQDAAWGSATVVGQGGGVVSLKIDGNNAHQTFTAPDTAVTASTALSSSPASLPVVDTTGFPSSGAVWVGGTLCNYTGTSSTAFTGVTTATGGSTTAPVEMLVTPGAGIGHGVAIQSKQTRIADVFITGAVGSAIAVQGAGQSGRAPYECRFSDFRTEVAGRYGIEILPYASDGMVHEWVDALSVKGALFAGGVDWVYSNIHPTGWTQGVSALTRQLIRIAASQQQFKNVFLDSAPYDCVRFDAVAYGQNLADIDFQGQTYKPSLASSAAGDVFLFYGDGVGSAAQRITLRVSCPGRVDVAATPYPRTYLVGVQNLASPPGGKVQVLSSRQLCPLGSAAGGTLTVAGDNLAYTGVSAAGTALSADAAINSTSLVLVDASAFASSGIVTAFPPDTTVSPIIAMRIAYTGKSGNTLTGVTGVTKAITTGTGIAQHFVTGVTGGANVSAADDSNLTQQSRRMITMQGTLEAHMSQARSILPMITSAMTLRTTGSTIGATNPFKGTVTVAVGQVQGNVSHGLQIAPTFYAATPLGDPQQRWWVTVDGSKVYVNLAAAATGTAVSFAVEAAFTYA